MLASIIILFNFCGDSKIKRTESSTNVAAYTKTVPDWVKNAAIYEVNIRQYTEEGTFNAFSEHLPRLKELGVDILWLMPIYPISEAERKGSLGSYYAIKDFMKVNPEFGSQEDFRALVEKIHNMGMYVILDWVANHTGMDNDLIYTHTDWFMLDSLDQVAHPEADWSDVAQLNYELEEVKHYMVDAMKFWVKDYNIDGFRCDVAYMVPIEFWEMAREELDQLKPVFMLAEAEQANLQEKAFDMDYAWGLHHLMNDIAQCKKNVLTLDSLYNEPENIYGPNAIKMNFISNHDENSWKGTVFERMGDAASAMTVLSATLPGMPLVYSGQEAGLAKRLSFFEKDEIPWQEHEMGELYRTLLKL